MLVAVMLGSAAVTTGCDECTLGATECDGDSQRRCVDDGDGPFNGPHWDGGKCSVACRQLGGSADCVDSRDPVPECAGDAPYVCWNGVPTSCFGGYPIKRTACTGDTHCVMSPACGPTCALEDQPDPRCDAGQTFCDGALRTTCTCGLVSARDDCGGQDLCRQMDGDAMCVDSATPDPRCDPTQRWVQSCADETTALVCWYGFARSVDCKPGRCDQVTCAVCNGGPC